MHLFSSKPRALPNTSAILCHACDDRAEYAVLINGADDYCCRRHAPVEPRPALAVSGYDVGEDDGYFD